MSTVSPDKKQSTKNIWYKSSPKKETSLSPEEPKKKSKLSCLIASMSPKTRHKQQNGMSSSSPLLTNGDLKDRKSISPQKPTLLQQHSPHQEFYQSPRKPGTVTMKTCPTSNLPHHSHDGNCTNNYGGGSTPITTPIRTKAAKKYIPEDHLVIPQVVVTPPTPQVNSPKKTSKKEPESGDTKASQLKKKKKSSKGRRDEKKTNGKKKNGKARKEPPGFHEVCKDLLSMAIRNPADKKVTTKDVQEPFIFSPRKYTKIDKVMSSFTHPRNSFPKSPVASTSHTSSSGRKRKLNIVNDKMKETSSQIQRLPLKKRHHHTSSVEKSSGINLPDVGSGHKFGVETKPGFVRQVFQTTSSGSKWRVEGSADFGVLKKRQSESSTNSSTKENESSPGKTGAKKGRPSGKGKAAKNMRQSEPNKKIVLSPDIVDAPDTHRRSSRPRSARKLQLDNANEEEKKPVVETKVEKRGVRKETKKLKTGIDESVTTALASPDDEDVSILTKASTSPLKRGGGRKRNISLIGEPESGPLKKIKLTNGGGIEIESLNESEISTEVETDVEQTMMSPPSSVTTTPLTSPPQQQSVKKRRKVNRTGFPSVKKKKKVVPLKVPKATPVQEGAIKMEEEATAEPPSPAVGIIEKKDDIIIIKREPPRESIEERESLEEVLPGPSHSLKHVPKFTSMLATCGYVDSSEPSLPVGDVKGVMPEVILDLAQTPNPPVVVPPKSNYLPCGLLSNFFKHEDPETRTRGSTERENPLLPLPPDPESSEFTTTIRRDYVLPYDIYCMGYLRAKELFDADENLKKQEEASEKALRKEELAAARYAARRKSEVDTSSIASSTGSGSSKPKKAKLPENQPSSWSFRKLKSSKFVTLVVPIDFRDLV